MGIDYVGDTIDTALLMGFINQRGAWFDYIDTNTGEITSGPDGQPLKWNGKPKVIEWFKKNPQEFQKLFDKVYAGCKE